MLATIWIVGCLMEGLRVMWIITSKQRVFTESGTAELILTEILSIRSVT